MYMVYLKLFQKIPIKLVEVVIYEDTEIFKL